MSIPMWLTAPAWGGIIHIKGYNDAAADLAQKSKIMKIKFEFEWDGVKLDKKKTFWKFGENLQGASY